MQFLYTLWVDGIMPQLFFGSILEQDLEEFSDMHIHDHTILMKAMSRSTAAHEPNVYTIS
jgi:hypothetical protein